ncbi:TVG0609673 [Thermoplasma volcanium GSS1]|uniref:TVG0609673 protein n=1 Tax=Thermoplasma volcanium (strain ATCC 51530 / DSM 4299 / JCM 9571 / NBRC 15438 / GSS1) TaxID=273116 RepID=Q97B42_THEVO|nr:glycosyltransferase family 2 protein [Thermoplasma volcanium]BAB59759.1 TVG0609673 [Thermoplasma volcanium GSS1]
MVFYVSIASLIAVGFSYIGIYKSNELKQRKNCRPKTLVIIPCKGLDLGLEDNLKAITKQNYDRADYLGVVDSLQDESVSVLEKVGINYIISDYTCEKCSGKVKAIATAIKKYTDYDAYVIADSDIRPNSNWLEDLVSPLCNDRVGLSTTFPYFVPIGGLASKVKAVWGTVGQSLMESKLTRFGWGGSLAFEKSLISDKMDYFTSNISDDSALTAICKSKKLDIAYVKEARPAIYTAENFPQFWEWANRQTALSINASPRVFTYGIIFYSLYIFEFFSAVLLTSISLAFVYLFIPVAIGVYRVYERSVIKSPIFAIIYLFIPFIYLANLLKAKRMGEIIWRGRQYKLQKILDP